MTVVFWILIAAIAVCAVWAFRRLNAKSRKAIRADVAEDIAMDNSEVVPDSDRDGENRGGGASLIEAHEKHGGDRHHGRSEHDHLPSKAGQNAPGATSARFG